MGVAKKIIEGGLKAVAKKSARAKDLERKVAASYAQMPEYLQDPYLGLSTSNIGKVTKSLIQKAPRMSKAELEASGYYHPIGGGLKLSKPAQEFTANIVEDPAMPLVPKILRSPEELYGKVGIPFVGDRSDTGKLLRGIEGVDFDEAIKLEGGHKFGRAHQYEDPNVSSVWASDPDVVTSLLNQVRRAGESGKDVLGISSMGSPKMVDFNTMVTKGTLNMTDVNSLSREAIEEFNNELRNKVVKNKKTGKVTTPFKDFLGIDHPELETQLLSQEKGTGELRKAFISIMDKDKYRKLGFPEIAPIRKAVTDPEILDMPLGSTGLEIYKMSPEGKIVEAPKNPHSTYPMHMQGEYFGGLEVPIDYKNMFSTFYEPKKLFGVKDPQAYRAYSLSAPIQEFNQQWLDEVMPIYQQKMKELTGRKKGGEVTKEKDYKSLINEILSEEGYAEGGSVDKDPDQLRDMIKSILGSDVEKADGGTITTPEIEVTPIEKMETLKEVPRTGKISGKIADVLKPASRFLEKYEIIPQIPLIGGTDLAELTGVKGVQTLAEDMSYGYKPIRNLERGKLQSSYFDPRLADAVDLGTTALGGVGLAKNLGKTAIKEGMKQIETGTGMLGRNVINPRMNIIKDPGGMVVGGEKVLDTELLNMKKNEAIDTYDGYDKDPNAVALNQWIDTKVRKYIRNQAGTENDPILKAIESGVEHQFSPTIGDTKYYVRNKRELVGKPVEGIAKTDLGKEWEYKVDSTFTPKKSADIKEILNMPMEHLDSPAVRDRRRASMLRVEQDLPIHDEKDLEALKLINQIPDENVYTIDVSSLTNRLGLNHVSDVLYEDLQSGRLRPEQLNQMSIEKAIRRTAEYDAEKAKAMTKAHATSIEGMPIPKAYDDGYKWVELKHESDPKKTAVALKSEGEMMGHCVGGYCGDVESGEIKIFSLRGPDGKSHVTIEARPRFNAQQWYEANADLINSDPYLKEIEPNIALGDIDAKYGNNPSSDSDYIRIMTKEMKKKGINPAEPSAYMELHQVKGKQNKRPDDKYQSYISDFIKNNPTKHEIVDVFELDNTNLMGAQNIADNGIVSKDIHNHPEVEKILKMLHPDVFRSDAPNIPKSFSRSEELKYELFQETARDLARQGKNYLDKDDILNHLREKYLLPKKKSGGSINLNQEYKLENLRRRYG